MLPLCRLSEPDQLAGGQVKQDPRRYQGVPGVTGLASSDRGVLRTRTAVHAAVVVMVIAGAIRWLLAAFTITLQISKHCVYVVCSRLQAKPQRQCWRLLMLAPIPWPVSLSPSGSHRLTSTVSSDNPGRCSCWPQCPWPGGGREGLFPPAAPAANQQPFRRLWVSPPPLLRW